MHELVELRRRRGLPQVDLLEQHVDGVADLGRREPALALVHRPELPLVRPEADDPLDEVAVRAAVEEGDRRVRQAPRAMERRLRHFGERRKRRRIQRLVPVGRDGEELELLERGRLRGRLLLGEPVDPQEQPGPVALDLDRAALRVVELPRLEPLEHPADRRARVRPALADRARDDQPVDRAGHRHVVEAPPLGLLGVALGALDALVVGGREAPAARRIGDAEAEPPVREAEDLVGVGPPAVAARVRDDDDLELEPLGRVDRQEADHVRSLLLGRGLELGGSDRVLLGDEADEALDVRAAQLLVRACEPPELAQVRVPAAAVPLREHREVVVVLADDLLAEPLERQRGRLAGEPVVPLLERLEEPRVACGQARRQLLLEPGEERPPRRRAPQQDERVVGDADERRGEHGHERLVVVAVVEQAQVREQVDDLLLPVVVAPGRAEGRQALGAQLLLVEPRVGAGREQEHDLARSRLARVDERAHALRDVARLCGAPVRPRVLVAVLVGDEQLDGRAERGVREASRGRERVERLAEVGSEQVVDHVEDLGTRAVVLRQRQHAARLLAPLAEDLDVRVPEAVDRLELVPDEEQLAVLAGEEVDQLALQPVRVLELVDHHRAEAPALALADVVVLLQDLAREKLEVLEVERGLTVLRLAVGAVVGEQELLELLAVSGGERFERGPLDGVPRLLVRLALAPAHAEVGEVEQHLGRWRRLEEAQRLGLSERGCRRAQVVEPFVELRVAGRLELQRQPGRAKRLVHARQHPPQPAAAVRREQPQALRAVAAELLERGAKGLAAEDAALAVVEDAEARVDPGGERVRLQQAAAETVDGRDPGAVELPREVVAAELDEALPDPSAQLAGSALGVRDHEDRVDVEPALAHRAAEALDDHGRLAGPGARRDEHDSGLLDGPSCSRFGRALDGAHVLFTRHIGQRSHQVGHGNPFFGSCRTSPALIRSTIARACSLGAVDLPPERVLVEVVVAREPGHAVVARLRPQQPARLPLARKRAVDAAERLDPDEVAQHEHVERDLEVELGLDLPRRVRGAARLVVDHDPARAERVAVDAVDLPRDGEAAEVEAALQLGGGALGAERDLEPVRDERRRRLGLRAHELLEVAGEALLQLAPLELREVGPDVSLECRGKALAHEVERVVERLGLHLLGAGPLRQALVEAEQHLMGDAPAQQRVDLGVDRPRRDDALEEPHRRAVGEALEVGDGEARLLSGAPRARPGA